MCPRLKSDVVYVQYYAEVSEIPMYTYIGLSIKYTKILLFSFMHSFLLHEHEQIYYLLLPSEFFQINISVPNYLSNFIVIR